MLCARVKWIYSFFYYCQTIQEEIKPELGTEISSPALMFSGRWICYCWEVRRPLCVATNESEFLIYYFCWEYNFVPSI